MDQEKIIKDFEEQRRKAENRINNLTEEKVQNSVRSSEEVDLLKNMISTMRDLISVNATYKQLLEQQAEIYPQNYISTTQYGDSSLAKDLYNMNGNSLGVNSRLAMRQLLGIVNGSALQTTDNKTQQQSIPGLKNNNTNNSKTTDNGSGVGLVKDKHVQGWGLGIFILNRIEYFANLVTFECSDKELKKVLTQYMFNVICAGRAIIQRKKINDKYYYRSLAIDNFKEDEGGLVTQEEITCYSTNLILNNAEEDSELSTVNLKSDDIVYGAGRTNGYSIGFYALSYLINGVDLLYIFWNKSRMTKTVVLQKKSNSANASQEAEAITNPYQLVVPINTSGYGTDEKVTLENRYQVEELGNPDVNMGLLENFYSGMSYGDGVIGIRTAGDKTGDNRSITDEIKPFNLRTDKIQRTMLEPLDNLCEMIKEKGQIELSYEWKDEEESVLNEEENPAFKNEGGNEQEMELKNGKES